MNILQCLVHTSHKFDVKYNFIEINDFGVIFWQKLANLNDIVGAINLFSVKIDKQKLQSSNIPLQTYHWSLFN